MASPVLAGTLLLRGQGAPIWQTTRPRYLPITTNLSHQLWAVSGKA